jgi:hypothetical protein
MIELFITTAVRTSNPITIFNFASVKMPNLNFVYWSQKPVTAKWIQEMFFLAVP